MGQPDPAMDHASTLPHGPVLDQGHGFVLTLAVQTRSRNEAKAMLNRFD